MIPEIGHVALILALCLGVVQGTLPLVGAERGKQRWMALARPAAHAQFTFVAIAFACLAASFLANDFSVRNVAMHSNASLPLVYRFTATWGSHEGSILLWSLMLAGWTLAVSVGCRHLPLEIAARVIGVMGVLSVGLLSFTLFTSNPFERLVAPPADGRDLNPLLQDPGMVLHPPLLYMGYVGFSVAFAFALAALLAGRSDAHWARWSRPWTIAAWAFLTIGIAVGSWWAYYELGWGGWWFWDPVENASLMPWLVGTALIHSLAVTEKRGAFRSWTVLLAILAFSLSLLGTFLVRSGVLTSVHAFATDPRRGLFILILLALVTGGALAIFALRAPGMGRGGRPAAISRESMLLANNVLLVAAAATVLLGTVYPIVLDALGLAKISVGPPYFETVLMPILAPLAFLMGVGPIARWRQARLPELVIRLRWALAVSAPCALVAGGLRPWVSFGLLLAFWIVATTALQVRARLRSRPPASFWGMTIAHLGVAVLIIGVTLVKGFEIERDVRMTIDSSATVGAYTVRFSDLRERDGPNYRAAQGVFEVARGGRRIGMLYPEKRVYDSQPSPTTEAAIRTSFTGDLYVALGEPVDDRTWSVRIYDKPFVTWIWAGCLLMALGGFVVLADRRYRVRIPADRSIAGGLRPAR